MALTLTDDLQVTIGAAAFPLQRSPDIYGAEPNSFVPERWIENPKPEMRKRMCCQMFFGRHH
jgi:hypothetical protein